MAITATYREVQQAVLALHALGEQALGLDQEGKATPLTLPFRTALKIRRMLGLLGPLLTQAKEIEREVWLKAGLKEGQTIPLAVRAATDKIFDESCEVGSEILTASDLALQDEDKVQPVLSLVLAALGPFWTDEVPA